MLAHEKTWNQKKKLHYIIELLAKIERHKDGKMHPEPRKSVTTRDMALKNITDGGPWLIQKMWIEHRAAFVERFWLKRATPVNTSPARGNRPSGR